MSPRPFSKLKTDGSDMTDTSPPRPPLLLNGVFYAASGAFLVYMLYYYWTGLGGPTLLAMTVIPVTYVLFTLQSLRQDEFYPRLPSSARYAIAALYCIFALYCAYYMHTNYEALGTSRAGFYDRTDLIMGGGMALLVIEYARQRHLPLFVLTIILVLYAVYGYFVPGMFYHAGLDWSRIVSASSVEMDTGIFSRLPQIALTLIGSFLLVLSLMRGFGCVDSLLAVTKRIAIRSPHAIPQSAVIGSMLIGTVSGSGAANSMTVGSATIPAMVGAGLPPATAAAIENASSMGGQIMPPVMGIAAFLMAEFLGVDYFEVVARGWAPALIYYGTVAVSVYLLAVRYRTHMVIDRTAKPLTLRDKVNLGAFALAVSGLIVLMAVVFLAPMFAALDMFYVVGLVLLAVHTVPLLRQGHWSLEQFVVPLRRFLDSYIEMITDIALLLATLGIMTGALVITGVPVKLGTLLVEAGGINLVAMVGMGFIFGVILGCGLPPAPTYILVAIVIAPPFIQAGVNPWVVHFFAFFLGVFGELTPPTSITAAITSKIAGASFYQTLFRSMQICVALFTLMIGIFIHPDIVVKPGLDQLGSSLLIGIATIGISFSLQATFFDQGLVDRSVRVVLAVFALSVLLIPNTLISSACAAPVVIAIAYWLGVRRRKLETNGDGVAEISAASLAPSAVGGPESRG